MDAEAEIVVVVAAQGGSDRAWRELFELHFDAVYHFCLTLTGGRCERAEETTQQVFITAAETIQRFDPERGTFRSWLLGIARNRYMTLRAREHRRSRHERVPWESDTTTKRNGADVLVHETLARLPCGYRRALEDKYLRQLTMKEMAQTNGGSIEAIESLLRRARDRFACIYERMQNEE